MKKVGLFVASLMLAGSLAMAADPVYSVNTVGYQKLNLVAGYNFMGANWNVIGGDDNVPVQSLFSKEGLKAGDDPSNSDIIYVWDPVANMYIQYFLLVDDGNWYRLGEFSATTDTVVRGSAMWLYHIGSPTNSTVVGEVPLDGTNVITFASGGYTMFASPYTTALSINGANVTWTGTPGDDPSNSDIIYVWNPAANIYIQYFRLVDDGKWYKLGEFAPTTDSIQMGQGAFYKSLSSASVTVVKPY